MLSNAIDLNIDMATSAAKKLRKYGYPAMLTYINITVSNRDFQSLFMPFINSFI